MASTINTLGGTSITQISQATLPTLSRRVQKVMPLCVWDLSPDLAQAGTSVSTRVWSAPTVVTFDSSNGYQTVAQTSTVKTVSLTHYHITVGFTDVEVAATPLNLIDSITAPMVTKLVDQCFTDINALVTNANFSTAGVTVGAASFGRSYMATLANKLTVKNAPQEDRYAVLNADYYEGVIDDLTWSVTGNGQQQATNNVGMIHGMQVVESSSVANNSENLVGWAGHKSAIVGAVRLPSVPTQYTGEVENIVDPATGFPCQLRKWYSNDLGQMKLSVTFLAGFAKGNDAISRITSS